MSTSVNAGEQSTAEVRTHVCDFTNDLRTGVSLTAVTAEHIPPQGSTPKTPVAVAVGSLAHVTLANVEGIGTHQIKVLGFFSDGDVSEIRLTIAVRY